MLYPQNGGRIAAVTSLHPVCRKRCDAAEREREREACAHVPSILTTASLARVCSCCALCCSAPPAARSILSTLAPPPPPPPCTMTPAGAEASEPTRVSNVERRIASPMSPYRMPMTVTGAMKNRNVDASNACDR